MALQVGPENQYRYELGFPILDIIARPGNSQAKLARANDQLQTKLPIESAATIIKRIEGREEGFESLGKRGGQLWSCS